MAETNPDAPLGRYRAYVIALGLLWVVPAVVVGFGYLVSSKELSSGQCEGIGFGCELAPANYVLLLGVLATPILFTAGLVAVIVIAAFRRFRA